MGKLNHDRWLPGRRRGTLVLQHHSFHETIIFLGNGSRRAQFAPPIIDQRCGDVVLPSNLRDTRAWREGLFQNAPPLLTTPATPALRPPKTVIRPTNTAPKSANMSDLKTGPSAVRQGAAQRMRTTNHNAASLAVRRCTYEKDAEPSAAGAKTSFPFFFVALCLCVKLKWRIFSHKDTKHKATKERRKDYSLRLRRFSQFA
jgi:hypothetical protein